VEYATSVVLNQVTGALLKDLKSLEFNHRPRGGFGIGISMRVTGQATPIRHYREKQLETEVICEQCTLRYMIYGVFGFCPDCREHNSLQILDKDMAQSAEGELLKRVVENALEDCVSAFDGFGREICRIHAKKSSDPAKAEKVSFQNLDGAKHNFNGLFNLNLSSGLNSDEWKAAVRGFQKRHLLSHTMGVIDDEYVRKSGDIQAVPGRKINVDAEEVRELVRIVGKLAHEASSVLRRM
jgi:hypothetical protein